MNSTHSRAPASIPIIAFASRSEWTSWLERHHALSAGPWVKFAKRRAGVRSLTYGEAVDAALCFGWIDGQRKPFDADWYIIRFTPRRARSKWSQLNRERAEALIASGAMQPAGLAEVTRAKADGRWAAAYSGQSTATVPADLQRALDKNKKAAAFFATLDRQNRYSILYRVHDAKRPETRDRRIKQFVQMLARGDTIHPSRRP